MRTSVHIPDELLSRAKRKAAAEGRTLTSLIQEGLRLVMAGQPGKASKRILPRVSKHRGGLQPGIDPNKILQHADDIDDQEYAEKMRKGFK